MHKLKTLALTVALAASTAMTVSSTFAADDEIVIYRSTNANRCTQYIQPSTYEYFDEELDDFVTGIDPGGRFKYSNRNTSYVIFNKSSGEFREVNYQTTRGYDMEGKRTRTKEYFYSTGYADDASGYTPSSLFETNPASKRNYLVLSLFGTGIDSSHYFEIETTGFGDDTFTGVNTETVAGIIRLQKIRHDLGTLECLVPASLTGEVQRESEDYYAEDDQFIRTYCGGRKSLRLDKARTRDFIDAADVSMKAAEDAVIAYLEGRGYIDGTEPF